MTTSTANSVRALILMAFVLAAVSTSALAADGLNDPWFNNNQPCSSCDGGSGSDCIGGLDDYACGDMSPLAMLPGGQFYFQANLLAIRRHAAQNKVFQTRNVNTLSAAEVLDAAGNSLTPVQYELQSVITRDPILATDDLVFQNSAGYRMLLGWQLAEKYAIEFSYFDLNDWDETKAVSDATPYLTGATIDVNTGVITAPTYRDFSLFSPFTNFGDPAVDPLLSDDFDYNDRAFIRYESSLDNVEINVRHMVTKNPSRIAVSVLWGGRHNAIREHFTYFSSSPTPTTNTVNSWTRNDMWGAQIGTQIDFCWDPGWQTEFEIKGGVAHNRAVYEGVYDIQDGAGGGLVNYADRVDKDVTSWIGEMRLTLVYQFNAHLTTHVGYEALMLSRVALASENFETDLSILANGPWVLNNGGSVVYHGPSAGLTFAW